jgi:hypothetical protein
MGLKNIVVLSDEAHHCYRDIAVCATFETRSSRALLRMR